MEPREVEETGTEGGKSESIRGAKIENSGLQLLSNLTRTASLF